MLGNDIRMLMPWLLIFVVLTDAVDSWLCRLACASVLSRGLPAVNLMNLIVVLIAVDIHSPRIVGVDVCCWCVALLAASFIETCVADNGLFSEFRLSWLCS
jgi:hypothetical protein